MKYIMIIFLILSLSACEKSNPVIALPSNTPTIEVKKDNINFEVTSFKMDYEDKSKKDSDYFDETYTGTVLISAIGDEKLVKKPYSVLVSTKKLSGGTKRSYNEGTQVVIVTNGIGSFTTSDWNFDKTSPRMSKPEYEVKIVGYMPFIELNKK